MKLFYRKFGQGVPFVIIHGLYGSSDNWVTIGRALSAHFEVWLLDLRNHGRSPHSDNHNYDVMTADLLEFLNDHQLEKPVILGHSMGGKTAMNFAFYYPSRLSALIIIDIAPKSYLFSIELESDTLNHKKIMEGMLSFDFKGISHREQLDKLFTSSFKSAQIRQFLLKNVKRNDDGTFGWIINLNALFNNLNAILDGIAANPNTIGEPIRGFPVLFVKGGESQYITPDDNDQIKRIFPYADMVTILGSGHWLHAEQPELLIKSIYQFLDMD